jgi:pilus assembly protein CpaE
MEEQKIDIIIFSNDHENGRIFEEFFKRHPELHYNTNMCSLKTSTEDMFLRYAPRMILIDLGSFSEEELGLLTSKLERVSDIVPLVGILTENLRPLALQYIKHGMRDFIDLPIQEEELLKVIRRFRKNTVTPSSHKPGKVYTFLSLKGGVGNTFVTVNTAVSMARLSKKRVLLWDMALQAGDIPFFLNCKPEFSIVDILRNIDQVDDNYLHGILPPGEHGISILAAPAKIEDTEHLTSQNFEKILESLMGHFDYIFIDGGYRLTDSLIPLVDNSHRIFITSTLELISLRSAARCIELLERLKIPPEKIKVIINRYNSKYEAINLGKAKEILNYDFAHFFNNDYAGASQSVNLGHAIIDAALGSSLNAQFKDFAKKIESDFKTDKDNKRTSSNFSHALRKMIAL